MRPGDLGRDIEAKPEPGPRDRVNSGWTRVTPGFFEALGNRIVMGRPITDADNEHTRLVAVINQTFAKRFFGTENPIGRHFGPAPSTHLTPSSPAACSVPMCAISTRL